MKDFRALHVWQCAHDLVLSVYQMTQAFPKEELYGLVSQMRRASASVAANIAEGCGRTGNGEFHRFLTIAMGSARELEYFLLLSRDLGMPNSTLYANANQQTAQVERMLASLIRAVATERASPR